MSENEEKLLQKQFDSFSFFLGSVVVLQMARGWDPLAGAVQHGGRPLPQIPRVSDLFILL